MILTIDAGTTNTRATIWRDSVPIARAAQRVGSRDTAMSGSRSALQRAVRDTLAQALRQAKADIGELRLLLATGMISSNMGLVEIPHLLAPAGREDLAAGMRACVVPEVCDRPIWFVPGVKNLSEDIGLHNCERMDMMRGEEAEAMALIARLSIRQPAILAIPGSHSKFIHLDARQRIAGCVTTLAGELLHVITHNTLLADALGGSFAAELNREMLSAGAEQASRIGLGRACFMVRTLDQFTVYDHNARANFLLGAVLGADLLTLKNSRALNMSPGTQFIATGRPLLRAALGCLVAGDEFFSGNVLTVDDAVQADLAGYGAILLAETRGLI